MIPDLSKLTKLEGDELSGDVHSEREREPSLTSLGEADKEIKG